MEKLELVIDFSPCSEDCPVLTGQPKGSLRYCPMLENLRHRNHSNPSKVVQDVRDVDENGHHEFYDHEDYTDCCLNFQCCIKHIK